MPEIKEEVLGNQEQFGPDKKPDHINLDKEVDRQEVEDHLNNEKSFELLAVSYELAANNSKL